MRHALLIASLTIALAGCAGQSADPGLFSLIRVQEAQLLTSSLPQPAGGPSVEAVLLPRSTVARGETSFPLRGRVEGNAHAVLLQADDDRFHWSVPVDIADDVFSDQLRWDARVDFSLGLSEGAHTIHLQALDASGQPGPVTDVELTITGVAPADGLVVALEWDRNVDLDLHVVTPSGVDINPKNINSTEPPTPGTGQPPGDPEDGGILDQDSNSGCLIDGRRLERVLWEDPPSGTFTVYADLFAACSHERASFRVFVFQDGQELRHVRGDVFREDAELTDEQLGNSPGLFVTDFTLP